MPRTCQIFRQSKVSTTLIADLPKRIEECFTKIGLKVSNEIKVLEPPNSAWDKSRGQYKADKIVENACKQASDKICLYLLEDDAYSGTLNFVFGVAHRHGLDFSCCCNILILEAKAVW
jgi:predicted Zn-dependent protease